MRHHSTFVANRAFIPPSHYRQLARPTFRPGFATVARKPVSAIGTRSAISAILAGWPRRAELATDGLSWLSWPSLRPLRTRLAVLAIAKLAKTLPQILFKLHYSYFAFGIPKL